MIQRGMSAAEIKMVIECRRRAKGRAMLPGKRFPSTFIDVE
jgi:hypothetical protein